MGDASLSPTQNAIRIIEYWLAQKHIDTSLLKSRTNLNIGIGCGCSGDHSIKEYVCYIVTAHEVVGNLLSERIPFFQDFLGSSDTCSELCPFLPGYTGSYGFGEFYDTAFCSFEQLQDSTATPDKRCQWCEEVIENGIECPDIQSLDGSGFCFGSSGDFAGKFYTAAILDADPDNILQDVVGISSEIRDFMDLVGKYRCTIPGCYEMSLIPTSGVDAYNPFMKQCTLCGPVEDTPTYLLPDGSGCVFSC